jgi:signal transduction histidine kinase
MQQALTTADRRKDEFLATLAHELRNPLAPIRMGLEVLKRIDYSSESAEQTRAMMDRQLRQLVRLVDDLMDLSRISSGRIELHKAPVPLDTVLHSALESSRPLMDKMGHVFDYRPSTESLIVYADVTRLAQVFINLLNNAAKYTPPGGRVHLSVERHGREVQVTIRDTGVGISADALPYIFDMFTQVKGTSELAQGGLGIGLSLVKRLVELHGGTVEGRSGGVGAGAEFVVRLALCDLDSAQPSL